MNKRGSKHSHAIKILEETGREWESKAASAWRECVSGVGRDNRDKQVKKVVLFRPHANEILQKQWSGTLCISHYMDIGLSGSEINNPLSIVISFEFLYKLISEGEKS